MLRLVATCAIGLEELLAGELGALGFERVSPGRGAVTFAGSWPDVWRANLWLRTANRVLIELASFPAADGEALEKGAGRVLEQASKGERGAKPLADLLTPKRTLAVRATSSRSRIRDVRWVSGSIVILFIRSGLGVQNALIRIIVRADMQVMYSLECARTHHFGLLSTKPRRPIVD